jgi:hypothetical protein
MADEIPARIEDHVYQNGPLADLGRMDGDVPYGFLSWSSPFSRQLDKAARRLGCHRSRQDIKNQMFRNSNGPGPTER